MTTYSDSPIEREPVTIVPPAHTADPRDAEAGEGQQDGLAQWRSTGTALSSDETIQKQEAPQGFFKRTWARWWPHFKRRYWWYVAGLVVFFAIFLPCFFLLAIPAIAQMMVDQADLPIVETKLLNPSPDAIEFSMLGYIDVPLGVTLDDVPLKLYRDTDEDVPAWSHIKLPGQKLNGNTTIQITNESATIDNGAQFGDFIREALNQKTFAFRVLGASTVHIGNLNADITLDKTIEMTGLNGLKGFEIKTAQVKLPAEKDGTNLVGSVVIPNPSVVSIYIGDLTLNMEIAGYNVGLCTITDLLLQPGDNPLDFRAEIFLDTVIENLLDIISKEAGALASGDIEISASGNQTKVDGQTIPYYQNVLRKLNIKSKTSLVKILIDSFQGMLGGGGLAKLLNGLDPDLLQNLTNLLGSDELDTRLNNDPSLKPDDVSNILFHKNAVANVISEVNSKRKRGLRWEAEAVE